ncbi:acyltransferase family protein [Pseudoclavibacter helvolus]|uniref:acyltransferase family protein n=1 Tax=Pseudoclavibacter helvolus TaxID=255205 RepID=UPI0023EA6CF9|nr:acyltransferase family protein [Pseudoclavibacter helvolus]
MLRAVAVGAVLLYHLWPNRFTGGYVGVDIFFVISGFLITAHLLRHAQDHGRISLAKFWANRSRRLLPMACVVLVLTAVASVVWLPASSWGPALRGVLASTFYVQNWNLAGESVSYLARDYIVGPTQHFWSLSVEEQFYILWPLLFAASTWVAVRALRRRPPVGSSEARAHVTRVVLVRRYALLAVAAVFVASLAYSLWVTAAEPSLSYFSTFSRAWEFAAGALLAVLPGKFGADASKLTSLPTRVVASWLGYAMLGATIMLLPEGVSFPGATALLPVVGTMLVIWAGDVRGAVSPALLGRVKPIVYLGDISYSVYLWHWPIIVILPYALERNFATVDKLVVIAASIGLAALSKPLVEDRFRRASRRSAATWRGYVPGAIGMLAAGSVAAASLLLFVPTPPDSDGASTVLTGPDMATDPNAPLVPGLSVRTEDKGGMYDCFAPSHGPLERCDYGNPDGEVRIALIGDSHAAHLIPGLIEAVDARGWSLSTFVGMRCDEGPAELCAGAPATIDALLSEDFDLVLAGGYRASDSPIENVEAYWSSLVEQGVRLVPVVDVPLIPESVYACLDASGGDPLVANRCEISFADGLEAHPDRATLLADRLGLSTIDVTDQLCTAEVCQAVVGNLVVYQDSPSSHLTATFSRALAGEFGSQMDELLQATN